MEDGCAKRPVSSSGLTWYLAPGTTHHEHQFAGRELYRNVMDERQVYDIRATLNQELVPVRGDFVETIARIAQRQVRRGKNGWLRCRNLLMGVETAILAKNGI